MNEKIKSWRKGIFREFARNAGLIFHRSLLQLRQTPPVDGISHMVMGGQAYVSLRVAWIEIPDIPAVEIVKNLFRDLVFPHGVEKVYESTVALPVDFCQLQRYESSLLQGPALEEIGGSVVMAQNRPFIGRHHRRKLPEVAN